MNSTSVLGVRSDWFPFESESRQIPAFSTLSRTF